MFSITHKNGNCSEKHASEMRASCGALSPPAIEGAERYRCDKKPHSGGKHHCCGANWEVEWKDGDEVQTKFLPERTERSA